MKKLKFIHILLLIVVLLIGLSCQQNALDNKLNTDTNSQNVLQSTKAILPEMLYDDKSFLAIGENEAYHNDSHYRLGDFNGDKKSELLYYYNDNNAVTINVFRLWNKQEWAKQQGGYWDSQEWIVGDYNGDGKADILKYWNDANSWTADVHISTGSSFTMQRWATKQGGYWDGQKWFVADFNGDGKSDIAKLWNDNNTLTIDVHISTGSSFILQRWATQQGGYWDGQKWFVADFTGDGKADIAKFWNDSNYWTVDVHVSTGTSFTIQRWATKDGGYSDNQQWVKGDFNGDGKMDLAKYWNDNFMWTVGVHLSTGSSFIRQRWATQQGPYSDSQRWFVGDFNNDNMDDFINYYEETSPTSPLMFWSADAHISTGSSFVIYNYVRRGWDAEPTNRQNWFIGDFDNNALDDTILIYEGKGLEFATYPGNSSPTYIDINIYSLKLIDLIVTGVDFYQGSTKVTQKDAFGRYILYTGIPYEIRTYVYNRGVLDLEPPTSNEHYVNVRWKVGNQYDFNNSQFWGLNIGETKTIPRNDDNRRIILLYNSPVEMSSVTTFVDSYNSILESEESNNSSADVPFCVYNRPAL